ncbi:hypothetical protein [Qipengyuania qiaonensis]|uniref:Uncharacterized protein n=1 Tax=Qipengyuania qiaonensis TaxID=2867240 RepID=A0ABS7JBN0_9SPHN|nr:hypothetical protein [Qipengyuania qiaonensis]MBX7483375.1 hypothetical protein [Qipengyuania qiaonensis]
MGADVAVGLGAGVTLGVGVAETGAEPSPEPQAERRANVNVVKEIRPIKPLVLLALNSCIVVGILYPSAVNEIEHDKFYESRPMTTLMI